MKKPTLLFAALLLISPPAFAEENKPAKAADQTLAGLGQQEKTSFAEAVQKTDPGVIDRENFEKNSPEPVATAREEKPAAAVSPTPAVMKEEKIPEQKAAFVAEPAKKASFKIATPNIKTAEMDKNWDALFSPKMTPDSKIYTVQSGDSLYVLAARNHTTIDLIKKMNGLKNDRIYAGKKIKLYTGAFSVLVDKSENILILFADGKPVRRYHVSTGKNDTTPAGEFRIVNKLVNPTWFKTGAIYPPGSKDNVLGTRWLGFDKPEYGIHGTIEPQKVGQAVSEGCIRMLNKDVEELYSIIPAGTVVTVQE